MYVYNYSYCVCTIACSCMIVRYIIIFFAISNKMIHVNYYDYCDKLFRISLNPIQIVTLGQFDAMLLELNYIIMASYVNQKVPKCV